MVLRTSSSPMPYLFSAAGLASTRTAGSELPLTVTCPMPLTCDSFSPRSVVEMSYICPRSNVSDVSAIIITGASAGLILR